jgi:creatinine amidohydrolase
MSILKMEEMTWKEVENLDKKKSVVFVALSPIEEHGPHLPLGTDYIAAKDLLQDVVNNLEKQNKEYNYIIHPSFPIGYNECVMNYPGTISYRSKTIESVIVDFGESISRCGFSKMVIVNHHLDLGHIKAIENAKIVLDTKHSLQVLEVASSIIYSESEKKNKQNLSDSLDIEKEIHADFRETSFMLFNHSEMVKDCYRSLQPIYMDIVEFIKTGGKCWRKYGLKAG